jgi:predicted dehydrogenase
MSAAPLRVGIVGCGLVGRKRAAALRAEDRLVGCTDVVTEAANRLAGDFGTHACAGSAELLELEPDVVIVATPHDQLAVLAAQALEHGVHVLVEKPAGLGSAQVDALTETAGKSDRLAKVGFNHRFHPAIARAAKEVHSGAHGALMHLRARYGHGGRPGYEQEWRAQPERSGGGELVDQGMHLLDLTHWLAGPLPLHSALLRTQFWQTDVEDNAALLLGEPDERDAPWAFLHASWTEWKNMFSLEIYCRTGKLQVDGLQGSYGQPRLTIYAMRPELGPPNVETIEFDPEDRSWELEWQHFRSAVSAGARELLGDLESARYAWQCVEQAQQLNGLALPRPAPSTT